jgi:hypothetical protein
MVKPEDISLTIEDDFNTGGKVAKAVLLMKQFVIMSKGDFEKEPEELSRVTCSMLVDKVYGEVYELLTKFYWPGATSFPRNEEWKIERNKIMDAIRDLDNVQNITK